MNLLGKKNSDIYRYLDEKFDKLLDCRSSYAMLTGIRNCDKDRPISERH